MYSKSTSALTLTSTESSKQHPNNNRTNNQASNRAFASNSDLISDLPDLSHLSESERKIIEAVLQRQKAEEEKDTKNIQNQPKPSKSNTNQSISSIASSSAKNNSILSNNNIIQNRLEKASIQNSQRHSISDIAQECKQRYGSIDTGNVCDLCKKTKFASSGVGHACFSCKSRCCIRCSFKYNTKTKQIWSCIECKKKQDALLKSGEWLNSPILNKKNYASDYILNKANAAGLNLTRSSNLGLKSSDETSKLSAKIQNTGQINPTSKRQLPNISKIKQYSQENESDTINQIDSVQKNNSSQSVQDLINDNQFNNTTITTNEMNQNFNKNRKSTRLKQTLIKQASLNNPPSYFKSLNDSNDEYQDSLYENSTFKPKNYHTNIKSLTTSNQELRKFSLNSNTNEQFFSSPGSSISQLNFSNTSQSNRSKAERLQDPLLLLKKQNSRNSNSRINSSNNLAETTSLVDHDESLLFEREKSLNKLKERQDSISKDTYDSQTSNQQTNNSSNILTNLVITSQIESNQIINSKLNGIKQRSLLLEQRSRELLHADSLSSDPSDNSQAAINPNNVDNMNIEQNNSVLRKHSSKKRASRPRKQPALPVLPTNANPSLIKNKLLARLGSKQHSLTSSDDENLIDEFELLNDKKLKIPGNTNSNSNQTVINENYLEREEEIEEADEVEEDEEEEDENEDDIDEEIRSTTEYTTNDEMDLESASATLSARLNLNNKPVIGTTILNQRKRPSLVEVKHQSIDDYLVQNLRKEEILAAKINRFLSPCNWQLSNDGKKMIGHIILKRNLSYNTNSIVNSPSSSTIDSSSDFNSSSSLGVKIIGGRLNPITNQLSAYVVKVKKDSISDTIGRLEAGDEVVKWNGILLRGLTFDEVYSIMNKSKQDVQIEIIVERTIDGKEKEKIQHLIEPVNKYLSNATNRLSTANSSNKQKLKTLDQTISIGKIQLKIFYDSIEFKLFINILSLSFNNQLSFVSNSNLECVSCKLQLLPIKKKDLHAKSSEVCNLDKSTGLFFINQAFTFESIDDFENLNVQIDILNYQTNILIGKSNLELSSEMFENQLINLEIYPINSNDSEFERERPNKGVSVESLNSGSLNGRRRQLPQIPQEKQQEIRNKVSIDLALKSSKIKEINAKKDQYSVSDSETMVHFKPITDNDITSSEYHSQHQSNKSTKSSNEDLNNWRTQKKQNNNEYVDNNIMRSNDTKHQVIENKNILSDSEYYESDSVQFTNKSIVKRTNNDSLNNSENKIHDKNTHEIKSLTNKNIKNTMQQEDFQKTSQFSNQPKKERIISPMSIKDMNKEFENYSKTRTFSDSEQPSYTQSTAIKPSNLSFSNQNTDENENSLYLNSNKPQNMSISPPPTSNRPQDIASSPSQAFCTYGPSTFQPLSTSTMNRSVPNTNNIGTTTKPEKLFSHKVINKKTQNVIISSNKNLQQINNDLINKASSPVNRVSYGFEFDSDGSDPSSNSVISGPSDLNKGANAKKISSLTASDGNRLTTVTKNPSNSTTTTTTTVLNNPSQVTNDINNQSLQQINKAKLGSAPYSDKTDGTLSDSALTNQISSIPETANKKRRPSMAKALVILGLSKKSNSASNLTLGKRFGFARSEEYGVMPELRNRNLSPSSADSSTEDKKPKLWSGALKLPHELPFNEFIENLGPGQKVSRQVLGLPCLGEVKLSMFLDKQKLNIEVIQVKNLKQKTGYRLLPNIYVKFYLYHGNTCSEKQKTSSQRRTLNPTYQEVLKFETDYRNSVLQATVWADYGKLDRKVFMGIAQIVLDDCNLAANVIGWYKLYSVTSIITDFSTIASVTDLSAAESGYSIASQRSVK